MKTNLAGWEAIAAKESNDSVVLCKYADPTEGARENLTADEARQVAKEDPSLIYAVADNARFSPSKITIFKEADGFHWDNKDEAKKRGYLDARGRGYSSRAAAMRAARENFEAMKLL